jgi:hypothetical protein
MKIELIQNLKDTTKDIKYTGTHPQVWFNKIKHSDNNNINGLLLLNQALKIDRTVLKNYLVQDNIDNKSALIAIMAWGNRNIKNAKFMFDNGQNESYILHLVNLIRNGAFDTRKGAFEYFLSEKKNKKYKGLGISYFTKILWFLKPELKGYILDQFTAKSMNLISDNKVKLVSQHYLSPYITAECYEQYCSDIDNIAEIINESSEIVEEKLFGGDYPDWRKFVNDNYKK